MEQNSSNRPKRVLITGCSSGFGLLTAVGTAKAGCQVIATLRNPNKDKPLRSALENAGLSATIDILDTTSPDSVAKIAEKYDPVDILVNNAGILIAGSFLDQTDAEARLIFETNYFGPLNLTKALAPSMIKRRSGRIINIASLAGLVGHPFNAAYAASKHALIGFSRSIRVELAPFNIDVISIEPGYHRTEIIRNNANLSENFYNPQSPMSEYNKAFLRAMFKYILPRAGDPDKVADKIIRIMQLPKPKSHYRIGSDARFALAAQWLGLTGLVERKVIRVIRRCRKTERRNTEDRIRN